MPGESFICWVLARYPHCNATPADIGSSRAERDGYIFTSVLLRLIKLSCFGCAAGGAIFLDCILNFLRCRLLQFVEIPSCGLEQRSDLIDHADIDIGQCFSDAGDVVVVGGDDFVSIIVRRVVISVAVGIDANGSGEA